MVDVILFWEEPQGQHTVTRAARTSLWLGRGKIPGPYSPGLVARENSQLSKHAGRKQPRTVLAPASPCVTAV